MKPMIVALVIVIALVFASSDRDRYCPSSSNRCAMAMMPL